MGGTGAPRGQVGGLGDGSERGAAPDEPAFPFALAYEDREWEPKDSAAYGRRLRDVIRGAYRAAVAPEIANVHVQIDRAAAVDAVEATAEIARFDAEIGTNFAPFAALLLRSESAASSNIEQLTASAKAVLMAEDGDDSRQNASLIAGNTAAMQAAIALADEPSEASIIEMHRALMERTHPDTCGHWRTEQVWIGGSSVSPHNATFVPPHHDRVAASMADLVAFMRRTDIDAFTQAMIGHAQFETIHPFPDGNGRTGRALIHAHLRHAGVTRHVTVPISAGLLSSTDAYFDALGQYRAGDPSPIVSLAAQATHRSIANGRQLAADIAATRQRWVERTSSVRRHSTVHRILDDMSATPLIDASTIQHRYEVSPKAAREAIERLVELGIVRQVRGGLRYRKFMATEIADALDAFAERAGRRKL